MSFSKNRELMEEVLSQYMPMMEEMVKDGKISFFAIFKNNLFACALCMGMGIIPFLYLPAWTILTNAMVMGVILAYGSFSGGMPVGKAILFGILPHGIFELPAVFLSVAMGLTLCKRISVGIFGKVTRQAGTQTGVQPETVLELLNRLAKVFVVIVIPLLIVAGVVESQFTPVIMERVM